MNIFKTILGIILILFGTATIIQMSSEESGVGLLGAFTGYIIILSISLWLLYSANKKVNENKRKIRTSSFEQNKKTVRENTNQSSIEEQTQSINILKDKGLFSESEFQEKMKILNKKDNKIKEEKILDEIKNTDEYRSLNQLFQHEIITQKEFEEKLKLLQEEFDTKLNEQESKRQLNDLKESSEYKSLKNLHDNGILSKLEFETKVSHLLKERNKKPEEHPTPSNFELSNSSPQKSLDEENEYLGSSDYWSNLILIVIILIGALLIISTV